MSPRPKKSEPEVEGMAGFEVVEKENNDSVVIDGESIEVEKSAEEVEVPERGSPKWSDYVMSQFTEDELVKGNPNVAGLRRVTEVLIGDIVESNAFVIECPSQNNDFRAVVTHEVVVLERMLSVSKRFTEVGDSHNTNTDPDFCKYKLAVASTRAEARALRKILGIKNVSSEELAPEGLKEEENFGAITNVQIQAIKHKCAKLNISVNKFINMGAKSYDDIEVVDYETAKKMIGTLNNYDRESVKIPESIKLTEV